MTENTMRAMIFDYGGVLMRTVDSRPRQQLERRFELAPGQVYNLVFGSPLWDDVQRGRIDSDAFWADVGERLSLDARELAGFREAFWRGDKLDQELIAFIRHLRELGCATALLSNAPVTLRPYLEELGIVDLFDAIVISAEEGIAKPARDIYHAVLDALDLPAEESMFTDDTQINVEAAERLGFHAHQFRGLAPLRAWLRSRGVQVAEPSRDPVPDPKAVIFDWGGVMEELPNEADVAAWERRLAIASGALPEILWGAAWRRLAVGAITDEEYVRSIVDRLGLPDKDAALDFLQSFYTSDRFQQEVMESARALRRRYKTAVLSNAFPKQEETIYEQYGIDVRAEFDVYVNSSMVGVSKPDPRIYELTLDRLGVAPTQAVFLDDSLRNVDAARALGINAIQFVRPDVTLSALADMLGHAIR